MTCRGLGSLSARKTGGQSKQPPTYHFHHPPPEVPSFTLGLQIYVLQYGCAINMLGPQRGYSTVLGSTKIEFNTCMVRGRYND